MFCSHARGYFMTEIIQVMILGRGSFFLFSFDVNAVMNTLLGSAFVTACMWLPTRHAAASYSLQFHTQVKADSLSMTSPLARWIIPRLPQTLSVLCLPAQVW